MHRILSLSLAFALCASAQSKPDYSGIWVLNAAASDFSDHGTAPDRLIWTFRHDGKTLGFKQDWAKGDKKDKFDIDLEIGGAPHVSDEAGIIEAKWKDSTLLVNFLYNPGTPRQSEKFEKWSLSSDGKRLIDEMTYRNAKGDEYHIKRVFDKQP
jgi:hypothetical protein